VSDPALADSDDVEDPQDALFLRFDQALAGEDLAGAQKVLSELQAQCAAEDPELLYCQARLLLASEDNAADEAAHALLSRVVELDDSHADALYDLGCLAEEHGDDARMVELFLRVRTLDALTDKALGLGSAEHFDDMERDARVVLDDLPEPFAGRMQHVPVIIERRPSRDLVSEGFDPRAFGLFEGPTDSMQGQGVPAPTRIVLFACNLLAEFPDREELREQVEITLLHEIGHYFGLDEDDMERLGLD
jgi:predicted Zn-dependent protease with MMP-like domain